VRSHETKIHLAVRPFKCPDEKCAAMFKKELHVKQHAEMHKVGGGSHGCEHCGKVFADEDRLKVHNKNVHRM
jgi:hypothetical protein